jgi:hypothetical protein
MGRRGRDLHGRKFGRLLVIGLAPTSTTRDRKWLCRCDCGRDAVVRTGALADGRQESCGCLHSERTAARNVRRTRHGHARKAGASAEYAAWSALRRRCLNPDDRQFAHYGGRGITVCERWLESFDAFVADMGPRPSPLHSIDRIDNDSGYEPGNCRWATAEVQNRNKRGSKLCQVAVCLIRHSAARGHTHADIAHAFDVTSSAVTHILCRNTWKGFAL